MSRRPVVYDEGLMLTAAMRVAAGQIPHRDFYANYGPAQFYLLAGLFKLFGETILVERLYDIVLKALVVTAVLRHHFILLPQISRCLHRRYRAVLDLRCKCVWLYDHTGVTAESSWLHPDSPGLSTQRFDQAHVCRRCNCRGGRHYSGMTPAWR